MKKYFKKGLVLFVCLSFLFSANGCGQEPAPITKSSFKLNTVVTITIYDSDDTALLDEAMNLCDYYENLFSRTRDGSEIYRVNHGTLTEVSDSTAQLLEIALSYSKASNGRFDPTIGAVSSLWDFHAEDPVLPDETQLNLALPKVDYQKVHLAGNQITLEDKGIILDLGAVAKGYIADRIKEYLVQKGVTSAVIDLGGNILCIDSRPDGSPFRVGIRKPFSEDAKTSVESLEITDRSVVTSGIYERSFELDGILYHHLLDPDTGYPCNNQLASVTIISDHSVDGDALSTTCYLLGLEEGLKFVNAQENVQAIFITKDNELYYSDSLSGAISAQ